jgi:hypothetical protein
VNTAITPEFCVRCGKFLGWLSCYHLLIFIEVVNWSFIKDIKCVVAEHTTEVVLWSVMGSVCHVPILI